MTRRGALALSTLLAIFAVSAAWWALALWPDSADAPLWLSRTRAVCFGVNTTGLPDVRGWLVLIGEPVGMVGFLVVAWGSALRDGLVDLWRCTAGRLTLVVVSGALIAGLGAVVLRIGSASVAIAVGDTAATGAPWHLDRLDREAPPLSLVDQWGDTVRLERFRGRPVVVTFAFGHCTTVCPVVVRNAARAIERTRARQAALLVVTLDPWRDTPDRLRDIARAWTLPQSARVLGGRVEDVERTLALWNVPRRRNPDTGDLVHSDAVYLIDRAGRLAFIAAADVVQLAELIAEL
jgi:protein SCO1/2